MILITISIFFIIQVLFFYKVFSPAILISFDNLIGIQHQHDILLFIFYLSLTVLKLLPIRIFYKKLINLVKEPQLDNYIEYFIQDFNKKKVIHLLLLLPMGAFVEEFIFRSLLLTIIVNYLNWNIFIAIFFISLVFGILHFSSSKSWAHFLSTLLSSIIYFLALIQLGLIYSWILHLTTNSLALLFFYQNNRKNLKK
ncbi:MAG: lysostaphin resistance A-like protein [Candidatus Hermodarchaeota archaeon]